MLASLASLVGSRTLWERAEYCSLALVFLGVLGESLAELWNFPKDGNRRHRLAKTSALTLIFGLALEFLCVARTNRISDYSIADLYNQAQQARAKADFAEATAKGFEQQIAAANERAKTAEAKVADATARVKEAEAQVALAAAQAEEAH